MIDGRYMRTTIHMGWQLGGVWGGKVGLDENIDRLIYTPCRM